MDADKRFNLQQHKNLPLSATAIAASSRKLRLIPSPSWTAANAGARQKTAPCVFYSPHPCGLATPGALAERVKIRMITG